MQLNKIKIGAYYSCVFFSRGKMAFFRRAGAAVEDPVLYVAGVASTLPSLLNEALTLVELLFKVFDKDGAGTLMFRELEHGLAKMGFTDQEKLQARVGSFYEPIIQIYSRESIS